MAASITGAPTAFVTFYSFKGGVGRSMALVNVAGIMAGRGFRVLALDMDLEAPGISYLMRSESNRQSEELPGFVDLLRDACERGEGADLFALAPGDVVGRYSYKYLIPSEICKNNDGLLRIMPAGKLDGQYQDRLDCLGLGKLYRDGQGKPLVKAFKEIIAASGLFDFVFVDSRTGFSDESGICTRDLADFLVVVMGLNRQNEEGTAEFLRSLRNSKAMPKGLTVVLSPVPNGEDDLVEKREREAGHRLSEAFGSRVSLTLQIPYHPRLALTEEPHIFRRSRGYLYEAYASIEKEVLRMMGVTVQKLVKKVEDAVEKKNPQDVLVALKQLEKLDHSAHAIDYLTTDEILKIITDDGATELRHHLASSISSDSWVISRLAEFLHEKKNVDAELFYERVIDAEPDDSSSLSNYANFLTDIRKDHDRAEILYRRVLESDSDDATTLGNYAYFLTDIRKDHDGAEELYRRALEVDSSSTHLLSNYANFLTYIRKDLEGAETLYRRVLEGDPDEADILGNYAYFLTDIRKDHDGAEAFYRRALKSDPSSTHVLCNYANFLTDIRKDHAGAEALYRRALEVDANGTHLLSSYANFLTEIRKDHDGAEVLYRRALEVDSSSTLVLSNYANFFTYIRKDHDRAEDLYRRVLEGDPDDVDTLSNYANFLTDIRKDHDGAEALYRRALEVDSSSTHVLSNYANFLTDVRKDHDGAEVLYRRALEVDSRSIHVLSNYANFFTYIRKDHDGAEDLYRRVLESDPHNVDTLCNYANFLTDIRKDYESADALYRQALDAGPDNTNTLGNYAKLLFIKGKNVEGEQLLARALALNPSDPLLKCELNFYAFAHLWDSYTEALPSLKALLLSGNYSEGWPLKENVRIAKESGHPQPQFIEALAMVVSGQAEIVSLDEFDIWKQGNF